MDSPWLKQIIDIFQNLLASFGVAEASRPVGALILLYLLVTLIALVFILVVWRISRRSSQPIVESDSEPVSAGSEIDVEPIDSDGTAVAEELAGPADSSPESVLDRVRSSLGKTRSSLVGRLDSLFSGHSAFNQNLIDELEEILITSDFGMPTTLSLIASLEGKFSGSDASPAEVYAALKEEISCRLRQAVAVEPTAQAMPLVVMVVGVNGVGKTTTIGKLASRYQAEGKKVLLGAGDTFRAAAADQLEVWSQRSGADIVRHQEGGDPAAVAFDSIKAAIARKSDVLILDTAGRLHTKANLMEELKKVCRVLGRELAGAPHQTLLVVDATTGQNALAQARLFKEAVNVDGIALTKLDGTAKGGIVVAISSDLQIPVRYIGIGESIEDLRPFDADLFVEALFGASDEA